MNTLEILKDRVNKNTREIAKLRRETQQLVDVLLIFEPSAKMPKCCGSRNKTRKNCLYMEDMIVNMLKEHVTLHRAEIHKLLDEGGYDFSTSRDPLNTVSSRLSCSPKFVSDNKGMWRLA